MTSLSIKPENSATTLIDRLLPGAGHDAAGILRDTMLVVMAAQLLWLSAKLHVPFWPVPMTMQTYAVLVLGGLMGWRRGAAAVMLYLAEGAFGLPVFSGTPERGIGLAYMAGPTAGYLAGFVAAAAVAGYAARLRGRFSLASLSFGMVVANALVFLPGILWLGQFMGGFDKALAYNLAQFGYAAGLKTVLAILTVYGIWRLVPGKGGQQV